MAARCQGHVSGVLQAVQARAVCTLFSANSSEAVALVAVFRSLTSKLCLSEKRSKKVLLEVAT